MQYLIRTLTDSTGHPFTHITQARENETVTVVDAESKEEAERKSKDLIQCPKCESWNTEHEYMYAENTPVYLYFMCNDCNSKYVDHVKKGQ
ncbi:hypothetical protein BU055_02045 [Staphylococcus succinus]|uniref:DUF1381 domain-containing protein n=1 Tax=Staphylococcus succinus TaxID=61015 RepID=UPI000D1F8569|nr:DUF1381 domain-containing protein [Staphylococcus succinus]PTJ85090.1 hypothetical protein BU055_02045 [Staphylococcus succinus]